MTALGLAFCLGFVSGLRVFTPVAAVLLGRGGTWGFVASFGAVFEYVIDLLPSTPSRTRPSGLAARAVSGALVGWIISLRHGGSPAFGAVAGIAGAMIGAYGGLAGRRAAITRIGAYPAAILEDLVAIGLAALIVTR